MAIQNRVTDSAITTTSLNNLQRGMAKGVKLQEQLSSGKVINRPSDSPTGTITAMQLRGETRAYQQYSRNADDGIAWLSSMDNTLSGALTQVNRARDLTVQGLSDGGNDAQSRGALADEVDQLRTSLMEAANTRYLNRPIFGGTTTNSTAYDANGTYIGDNGSVVRTVGANAKVDVSVHGPDAFGTGNTQLFTVLDNISKALRNNDTASLNTELGNLDTASATMKNADSSVGARLNRMTQLKQTAADRLITLASQRSEVEDVDLPKAIMDLQLQQTSYQAALAATAKVIQPSLLNFLD